MKQGTPTQKSEIVDGPVGVNGMSTYRANFWSFAGAASSKTCYSTREAQDYLQTMHRTDGKTKA